MITEDTRLPDYILEKHLKANNKKKKQLREAKKNKRRTPAMRTKTNVDD
jgi:hypothetical protein